MATGENTTGSLPLASPRIIASARIQREWGPNTWRRTCRMERQEEGTGLEWIEGRLKRLDDASAISETGRNENYLRYESDEIKIETQMVQILVKQTRRSQRKWSKNMTKKTGALAGNAMSRKKNRDYLATFAVMSSAISPGSGQPMSFTRINAGTERMGSNDNEETMAQVHAILRGEQIHYIRNQMIAGVGTLPIPEGISADVFRKGFAGDVGGAHIWRDNLIAKSGTDARGAVHSQDAVVAVQSMTLARYVDFDLNFGGGADVLSMVDEYGFLLDQPEWSYQLLTDATAPTS